MMPHTKDLLFAAAPVVAAALSVAVDPAAHPRDELPLTYWHRLWPHSQVVAKKQLEQLVRSRYPAVCTADINQSADINQHQSINTHLHTLTRTACNICML